MHQAEPNKVVIVIAGPTAVGKTAVAIALARHLGTAIISADSRQCYRGMAIGTAQASAEERALAPHHFVDCFDPIVALTAKDFEQYALNCLSSIFEQQDQAIVCGGTGLYIKALCEGLDDMPAVDPAIDQDIQAQYEQKGLVWLQQSIAQEDPLFYEQGERDNPARMLRALSFKRSTGQSILSFRTGKLKPRPFKVLKIGLELPRELLYARINQRVEAMMQAGLLQEAQALYEQRQLKSLNTVGYSELFDYLSGNCSLEHAVEKIKQHSRNYAKRQMTWFKKDPSIHWVPADADQSLASILQIMQEQL